MSQLLNSAALTGMLTQLQDTLKSQRATLATAESCTGGLVAALLTELAGSSKVYLGGVTAYANAAKTALLGVDDQVIRRYGAVSSEVAQAMAHGVQNQLHSTYALAITGIAGPAGGTTEKPIGTVYCGLAGPNGIRAVAFALKGDRAAIRQAAAEHALRLLMMEVLGTQP